MVNGYFEGNHQNKINNMNSIVIFFQYSLKPALIQQKLIGFRILLDNALLGTYFNLPYTHEKCHPRLFH